MRNRKKKKPLRIKLVGFSIGFENQTVRYECEIHGRTDCAQRSKNLRTETDLTGPGAPRSRISKNRSLKGGVRHGIFLFFFSETKITNYYGQNRAGRAVVFL